MVQGGNLSKIVDFEKKINFGESTNLKVLYGILDEHLRFLEDTYKIKIFARGRTVLLRGKEEPVNGAYNTLKKLHNLSEKGLEINKSNIRHIAHTATDSIKDDLDDVFLEKIHLALRKSISPKSSNQKRYIDAIKNYDIVIGIGPAGTGKTYLAMAMAISALMNKKVNRLILARPAVEAGERLGFLPGDMYEKVHPYLRPLYDALYEMIDKEKIENLVERGSIEIAPLAFMRGRTLNDSFVILDEAQNTTSEQMKMFLTRLGSNSKAVITGDITQIDLPEGKSSGLIETQKILSDIEDIKFVYFDEKDVVRHDLIKKIIKAYENNKNGKGL
ncbi:MAG: phosphate starvation-inducible protein PhoH [Candidatus Schekmanbacteria bacterium RIFCSPHIGHO2_02_FULL_38_11]|uniref:PhoH-like protein n=1 Tax=Candidatus Schekmanbacteria bacterium RIFCSPLOWO2_12_FULL_38_15 TaxID=1817883 RepID=A0A1F7SNX6_9BACT|nr:MAG: phosphate starvation-inducible protein PhoH [Candidatus Schekmanbacteria bacterium GWA2_38_9]OGL48515.1 MAG: phosphate starvation-inducible protein PhoH [Candidatus Schekmanbacteria bacterium RIFCSPHIGHO2_02_FULL_38_11]OGL50309.1 MAG: phosphate starvation-inducible protein PhoH [Candidatus Schekmanbacteria bacterium RIFCSPLOWO2_02_FULL_38_14]OGL55489.1 MAG: phosphate starvation-inducible protein PhoH [Candidatus Schekmanbacteria bacterium RIFCSPLOWO2_12_FULL_38_15]